MNAWMKRIRIVVALAGLGTAAAWAGPATDQIKTSTDKVIALAADPALQGAGKITERRGKMREVIGPRFDWQALAQGTLSAEAWDKATPEQKQEFATLFRTLLERTYMKRIESYTGETVKYVGEKADGTMLQVTTLIVTTQGTEVPLDYRVRQEGTEWLVCDVFVERVSLLDNYKAQFGEQLKQGPMADLIGVLKKKTAGKEK